MNCIKTLHQICDELSEDIDSPLCKEVKEHLENCSKCCAQVDSIRKVVYLYRDMPKENVPDDIDDRLWKVLNLQKPCE
ncbi:hypothetical protein B6I21_08860 [candidate division KSB1 bacterium 4572_119]|nr:MAG: hypothetical protein B6I21_08860 [candidate division KSB1 bacterium 4572_119]